MVPNRRLREELARADRLAKQRRANQFDDQATVVPIEDRVPEETRPGNIRDYAAADILEVDEDIELHTGDMEKLDPSSVMELATSDIDISDLTDETPNPDHQMRSRARTHGAIIPKTERNAPRGAPKLQPKPAPGKPSKRALFDFGDDDQTRIDPPSDPDVEVLEIEETSEPAPRIVKAQKLPLDEFPSEKSVVSRIVKSVVAALPSAIRKAVDKTGQHVLPGVKKSKAEPAGAAEAESRPQSSGVDTRAWREMRTSPIFDGLPNEALRDALMSGDAHVLRLSRDSLVPMDGSIALVRTGQVALGQFAESALAAERKAASQVAAAGGTLDKKERKRRNEIGPLIRVAEQNLATFEDGDVVETAVSAGNHGTLACYTATPAVVITIQRGRVDLWKRIYPFMADRFRRATTAARAKCEATDGAKSAVADFFIRHGLSVSMTLRVRKIDACIECKACEKACEERYGVKRLAINGRILGNLDFVDACHTCTDQRCIDPCNFDAISFDAQRKEVLIKEDACTGCTLCATACPYNAIEMHELEDAPQLKLRLNKEGKLGFGDGTPRKAKLRRMASKCDHCAFYEDQACITACPTGALVEILPSDAVTQLPDAARASAKAGYDRTVAIDVNNLNESKAFIKGGLDIPELGRARAPRKQLSLPMWWTLGIGAFLLSCAEISMRLWVPKWSMAYLIATMVEGIDSDLALPRIGYRPGCELAVNFGYTGTALMITGMFYVWRRRFSFMRNVGSLRSWFEWHVLTGVLGPAFILLHSVAKLDNWVSLGFWSMIITVISGLLGRYLTTQIEERASTAAMQVLDLDRHLAKLRGTQPGVRAADVWYEAYRRRVGNFDKRLGGKDGAPTFLGAVWTFLWCVKDDVMRGRRIRALRSQLKKTVHGRGARKVRGEAMKLSLQLALLERRRVLLPRLEPLFNQWKAAHIPMSVVLTIVATIHIVIELRR
jgi:Fe-S-cluster-containing hydrogenase component 2